MPQQPLEHLQSAELVKSSNGWWAYVPYGDILQAYFTLNCVERHRTLQLQGIFDFVGVPIKVMNLQDALVSSEFVFAVACATLSRLSFKSR